MRRRRSGRPTRHAAGTMSGVEALAHDHEALRQALVSVEGALARAEASGSIEARLSALRGLLARHLQREAAALLPYADRLEGILRAQRFQDHAEPQVVLRDLNVFCSAWGVPSTEALLLHLRRLLDELRERLEEEEREVFPVLETAELRNRRVTW